MLIVLTLSLIFFSCDSNSPQQNVIGTWLLDGGGAYRDDCKKLVIEGNGEAIYKINEFWQQDNGEIKQEEVSGIFRNVMGQMAIEISGHAYSIEYLPEAKKIRFAGCLYSKQ